MAVRSKKKPMKTVRAATANACHISTQKISCGLSPPPYTNNDGLTNRPTVRTIRKIQWKNSLSPNIANTEMTRK